MSLGTSYYMTFNKKRWMKILKWEYSFLFVFFFKTEKSEQKNSYTLNQKSGMRFPQMEWTSCMFVSVDLKRCTTWELWVQFYLRQNEDCSLGGSTSDSSERLPQSSSGGRSIYKVLVKGEFNTIKHSFYKRFFVGHKDLMSPWRDLVLL